MRRLTLLAAFPLVVPRAAPATAAAQPARVTVTALLPDALGRTTPVVDCEFDLYALTSRRDSAVVRTLRTDQAGTARFTLRPGRYRIVSTRTVVRGGTRYWWSYRFAVQSGGYGILDLTVQNADSEPAAADSAATP